MSLTEKQHREVKGKGGAAPEQQGGATTEGHTTSHEDLHEELFAVWSGLPPDQRRLWFRVLDTYLPPDSLLLEMLEDFEAARFAEAAHAARPADQSDTRPFEQLLDELGYV